MSFKPIRTYRLFFSYSHKDERLRDELATHLTMLKRQGFINDWHDRRIGPGSEWVDEIDGHLREADIIMLLVSANFLDSEYCYDKEMTLAMERHEAGEAQVLPVILRPCDWMRAPFSKLQALPAGSRPVTKWSNRDDAFLSVVEGVRSIVEGRRGRQPRAADRRVIRSDAIAYVSPKLPHLCDRNDQDREFSTALRRHLSANPQRPFVCVVHGDERESHSAFLERMQESIIPQVLNLNAHHAAVKEYILPWPSNVVAGRDFHQALLSHMGRPLLGNSAATREEILGCLVAHEQPLLVTSDRHTEDFDGSGLGLLTSFIKFWDEWNDLPVGRILISCILVKYRHGEELRFWRRHSIRRANKRLRKYVTSLEFSAFTRVSGIVVPELQAIRRSDVEAWIRDDRVRQFFTFQERDVRALYSETTILSADGRIPMEFLVEKLHALMGMVSDNSYAR